MPSLQSVDRPKVDVAMAGVFLPHEHFERAIPGYDECCAAWGVIADQRSEKFYGYFAATDHQRSGLG